MYISVELVKVNSLFCFFFCQSCGSVETLLSQGRRPPPPSVPSFANLPTESIKKKIFLPICFRCHQNNFNNEMSPLKIGFVLILSVCAALLTSATGNFICILLTLVIFGFVVWLFFIHFLCLFSVFSWRVFGTAVMVSRISRYGTALYSHF